MQNSTALTFLKTSQKAFFTVAKTLKNWVEFFGKIDKLAKSPKNGAISTNSAKNALLTRRGEINNIALLTPFSAKNDDSTKILPSGKKPQSHHLIVSNFLHRHREFNVLLNQSRTATQVAVNRLSCQILTKKVTQSLAVQA
ncbi:MAG: hypothetical protein NUV69_05885 [Candidatus Curtissbacteria bacterium]|nr:hypothetical protein [Candidatus Curtissbacteria bacterium]